MSSKNVVTRALTLAAVTMLTVSTLAPAAGRRGNGTSPDAAEGRATLVRTLHRQGANLTLPLDVDLRHVRIDGRGAVLGAYVIRVDYDPAMVEFTGVTGGRDARFAANPVATAPARGNEQGWVKIAGVHSELEGPEGLVNVGSVRFVEKAAGGARTIRLRLDSAASVIGATPGRGGIEIPVMSGKR